MTGTLDGKRVLITGSTQGIGAQVAEAFAGEGARLVLTGRRGEALAGQREQLARRFDADVDSLVADLAEPSAAEELADRAWRVFGGLDVLVNNAGISHPQSVVDLSAEALDATIAVNLRAPALLAARVGRAMAAAGGGSIITMASAAGVRPLEEHYSYCLAKAGLIMATNVLGLELGAHGVRANSLCPTVVLTAMGQQVWGDHPEKSAPLLGKIPLGRFAEPHEVSDAALWLASDASSMINGVALPVDGGLLLS